MGLFLFLTVLQAIVAFTLVVLVLMQRSEGGGLGIGGGSGGGGGGGLMSARGAADFLTRATKWSAIVFVVLAIVLAAVAVDATGGGDVDQTLDRSVSTDAEGAEAPLGEGAIEQGAEDSPESEVAAEDDPLAGIAE